MDDKIAAVLADYDRRIADEDKRRAELQAAGKPMPLDEFLLPVGPETGQLLNILARSYKAPTILEIGTSYGYSTIWLASAARASGGRVITMELRPEKSTYARQQATRAGLADFVDFRVGDAVELIRAMPEQPDVILLDLWKDLYVPCLEAVYPKLRPGAVIVADNMIFPGGPNIKLYRDAVRAKPGISTVLLAVGSGIEISRFDPA